MLLVGPNQGEVERLAGLLREYGQPYRLGSRAQRRAAKQVYDEIQLSGRRSRAPVIVQDARSPTASALPEQQPGHLRRQRLLR